MPTWSDFFGGFDWTGVLTFFFTLAASLFCITIHELSHGFAAYRLGDPTAKNAGRLTLNPIKHLDILGLLMMVSVHVGWAKPVPIDMRHFKHPKRDMAITALAGPVSNILITWISLLIARFIYESGLNRAIHAYLLLAFLYIAVLSLGLGLFNLIPVSPLDGSKVLLSFLPDRICYTVLRYERYISIAMVLLAWLGVFSKPLNAMIGYVMNLMCRMTGFPYDLIAYFFL